MPNSSSAPAQRLFPLPPELLESARSWVEHGERTPRKPRYASSVVLLRDGAEGPETYLAYRPGSSPLGVVAFPGGSLEASDNDPIGWVGPTPAQWAEAMGLADIQLARQHVVAAIRETFEETGVLLAGPDASATVEAVQTHEWMKDREALAVQDMTFAEILGRRGLLLRTDLLKLLTNWLSPDFAHRRFNTRYFAAALPVNQTASLLESKGVWGRWVSAADIIAQRATAALGDEVGQDNTRGLTLSEITVPGAEIILEKLSASRGCIAYLSHKRRSHEHQPRLVVEEGRFLLAVDAMKEAYKEA